MAKAVLQNTHAINSMQETETGSPGWHLARQRGVKKGFKISIYTYNCSIAHTPPGAIVITLLQYKPAGSFKCEQNTALPEQNTSAGKCPYQKPFKTASFLYQKLSFNT